jgi:hypothetical protein
MFWDITISGDESSYDHPHDGVECKYKWAIVRKPDAEYPFSWYPRE